MANNNDSKHRATVGLFATCLVDMMRPEVGFASAYLIESAGFSVAVPKHQTCCGQPLFNSGDIAGTEKIARYFLRHFEPYDYVVAPSGSCAAMVKVHYLQVFEDDAKMLGRMQKLAAKTYELTQFLSKFPQTPISARFNGNCTYHDSCSGYRELGIHVEPRNLLSMVDGLTLNESRESSACCGFGGTFCVKYPQISTNIAAEKADCIESSGADTLLGGDLGCLMNIAGTLSRRESRINVRHVAEVLADIGGPAIGKSARQPTESNGS